VSNSVSFKDDNRMSPGATREVTRRAVHKDTAGAAIVGLTGTMNARPRSSASCQVVGRFHSARVYSREYSNLSAVAAASSHMASTSCSLREDS